MDIKVKHYDKAVHDQVLINLAPILEGSASYADKRNAAKAAVSRLFRPEFSDVELSILHTGWSISGGTGVSYTPNASNAVARMNLKTLCEIVADHGPESYWPGRFSECARTYDPAGSFLNRAISTLDHNVNVDAILKAAKGLTTMPTITLPNVAGIINVADVLNYQYAHDLAEIEAEFRTRYPTDTSLISSAFSMRKLRGPSLGPSKTKDGNEFNLVESMHISLLATALSEAPVAPPLAVAALVNIETVESATADVLDGVLTSLGLPGINEVIRRANEGTGLRAQIAKAESATQQAVKDLEEAVRSAAMMPVIAPVSVASNGVIPNGTIVQKHAADLFGLTDPKRRKLLDFNVPCGEWYDDEGRTAEHPYVPPVQDDFAFQLPTLVPLLLSIVMNDRPWLRGHTGTGKTTAIEQVYARLNLPLYRVNLDSDISRSELVSRDAIKHDPVSGATITSFVEGIIPRSMQQPCGLLLDEVDASRPDLAFVLQRLTEGKGFMLLEDGGRTIMPHPWFRIFATANTNGRGDETGLYTGTRALGSAFINRFGPFLLVDYIDSKSEVKLVKMRCPSLSADLADQIVGYAKEHRIAFMQGQVSLPCSPRDTIGLATRMVAYLNIFPTRDEAIKLAFEHVVFNAADNDDVVILKGLADRFIKQAAAPVVATGPAMAPSFLSVVSKLFNAA